MSPGWELALLVALVTVLAVASAAAGALWWQARPSQGAKSARLAEELAARLRAVEDILARIEAGSIGGDAPASTTPRPPDATPRRRVDRGEPSAVAGPTLIA